MFLMDAWQKPATSTWRWLWHLYVFNDQYPPAFYLLSAPFFFLFDNHLIGARLYSATLAAFAIAIFYRILRLYVDRWYAHSASCCFARAACSSRPTAITCSRSVCWFGLLAPTCSI